MKKKTGFSLKGRDDKLWGWVFVAPFLIGFVFVFLQVFIVGVRFAFSEVDMSNGLKLSFVGLENFYYALRVDANFLQNLWTEIQELITTLPIVLVFALFVAVVLNSDVWGRTLFRAIFFLPVIVCVGMMSKMDAGNSVLSYMDSVAVSGDGNTVITAMGDITEFLQNLKFSPTMISFVSGAANNIMEIVNRSGVQILIFLAGIQSISPQLYEAAKVEGASAWVIFWKITLPMLTPMMLVNLIFTFVESLTRDNTVLLTYINSISFSKGQFGYASAMAWLYCVSLGLILAIIIFVIFLFKRIRSKSSEEVGR